MRRRGFTMIELMIVIVTLPIAIGAIGKLYLEGRIAATRIEATNSIQRNLALTHERIQRDVVGSSAVEVGDRIEIVRPGSSVYYWVDPDRGLVRRFLSREAVVAPRVKSLEIVPDGSAGYRVVTRAERRLVSTRRIRMERTSYIARRR